MQIQLIRSATLRIEYAGRTFVIDPYLAAKHAMPSYAGASPNPLVDLPCAPEAVIDGIEMALVSHLHSDHFDRAARRLLPKELPVLCQPGDAAALGLQGFGNLLPVDDVRTWRGIRIRRVAGQHGSGEVLREMGESSGFVFQAREAPTVYWVGDTAWTEAVADTLHLYRPETVITHSVGATWGDHVLIIMDAAQTVEVCLGAPESIVVAVHMESLDHLTVSRRELRAYASSHGIEAGRLLIPQDGEVLML